MLDERLVCKKFAEYIEQYKNEGIDDFYTFVTARVADYFINIEHFFSNDVFEAINVALFNHTGNKIASEDNDQNFIETEIGDMTTSCLEQNSDNKGTVIETNVESKS